MDKTMFKLEGEALRQHMMLKTRARRIPDKKKQNSKRACRSKGR